MVFIILSIILITVIVWGVDKSEKIPAFLGMSFLCTIVSLMLMMLFSIPHQVSDGTLSVDIVQLKSDVQGEARGAGCFLGWSVSGGKQQYVVMERKNEIMRRVFLNQDSTYIVESDSSPRVEYQAYKDKLYKFQTWFCFPTSEQESKQYYYTKEAIIYVPKGTVVQDYQQIK